MSRIFNSWHGARPPATLWRSEAVAAKVATEKGRTWMAEEAYDGLRSFIAACQAHGEIQIIKGADWNLEIGALTESASELIKEPPGLLFDEIKGYPKGYRVLSIPTASRVRMCLALGLPVDTPKMDIVRYAARHMKAAKPIPPREVETGPVMENVMRGAEVDLTRFPALKSHQYDGGRYIGTGDSFINRDPETGYVNVGTYRMQMHAGNLLGLWMSPGQQGRAICERYWSQGKACPVAATFGAHPLIFFLSYTKFPFGVSEFDRVGGMMGRPLDVIKGPLTGLPIPAHAEVAIEGEVPPPGEEVHQEGPFGEWPGYYTVGIGDSDDRQPVVRVKAVYHRNDPILLNMAPQWPGAPHHSVRFEGGVLWEQMEAAGVPGIAGVYVHHPMLIVVAIRQQYAGHARQTGNAAYSCASGARNGRFVVVVDEDIDPSNIDEVVWAMTTRVDPVRDIQTIDDCWASPLDPRMPPEKAQHGPHTNSRAVVYAVRPWEWRDKFPRVNRISREEMAQVVAKYADILPFPKRR
jgi:4-hydroxy-3-polyprenylbenzoate decarboxylase